MLLTYLNKSFLQRSNALFQRVDNTFRIRLFLTFQFEDSRQEHYSQTSQLLHASYMTPWHGNLLYAY